MGNLHILPDYEAVGMSELAEEMRKEDAIKFGQQAINQSDVIVEIAKVVTFILFACAFILFLFLKLS